MLSLWVRVLLSQCKSTGKGEMEDSFVVSVFGSRSVDIIMYQRNNDRVSTHHYRCHLRRRKRNVSEYIESSNFLGPILSPEAYQAVRSHGVRASPSTC